MIGMANQHEDVTLESLSEGDYGLRGTTCANVVVVGPGAY